ncbi:MAG: AAA family ATPase [Candidatus Cloacimonadaceae bacterium]
MIKNILIKNLTVFDDMKIELSPKINVIVGENASGKTHVLKALYAMSVNGSLNWYTLAFESGTF